jgi:hypothetical protein
MLFDLAVVPDMRGADRAGSDAGAEDEFEPEHPNMQKLTASEPSVASTSRRESPLHDPDFPATCFAKSP